MNAALESEICRKLLCLNCLTQSIRVNDEETGEEKSKPRKNSPKIQLSTGPSSCIHYWDDGLISTVHRIDFDAALDRRVRWSVCCTVQLVTRVTPSHSHSHSHSASRLAY